MKSFKNKFINNPVILALGMLVVVLTAFVFLFKHIHTINTKAIEVQKQTRLSVAEKREARSLLDFSNENQVRIQELDKHFVKGTEVVAILQYVEDLAPRVGASAKVSAVDVTKDGQSLFIDMNISGSFDSVYKFVNLLEQASYILDIINLDIQAVQKESGNTWSGNIKVKVISFIPGNVDEN